jgi:hypothetical protein
LSSVSCESRVPGLVALMLHSADRFRGFLFSAAVACRALWVFRSGRLHVAGVSPFGEESPHRVDCVEFGRSAARGFGRSVPLGERGGFIPWGGPPWSSSGACLRTDLEFEGVED